jgi:para-nitrobenzyl esterase
LLVACGSSADPSGTGGSPTTSSTTTTTGSAGGAGGGSTSSTGGAGGGVECPTDVMAKPGTVITDRGAVTGALVGTTYAYKNIPFAAPPVGDLRWKLPKPVACWTNDRDATAWGNVCPQLDTKGDPTGVEDCLSLNVWTPKTAPAKPLPVMVWIHGGGFVQGGAPSSTAGVYIYDGQHLSETGNAVIVSINYRLGALGFLAHPAFSEGANAPSSGNLGNLDQIAALEWVQRNAAAFGGDPKRVTIMGESAGGASVCTLVASPRAKGLFSGAIMESGGCVASQLATAEDFGKSVFTATKCDTAPDPAACMRALTAAQVIQAVPVVVDIAGKLSGYGAVVDKQMLLDVPGAVIKSGAHNHVPFIVGNNSDETSRAVPASIVTEADYTAAVNASFGGLAAAVLAQYPAASYASPKAAFIAVTSDSRFICGGRRVLRNLLAGQKEPTYRYMLTHELQNVPPASKGQGAWHGVDVLYLFGKLNILGYVPSAGEKAISDAFGGYWTRFGAASDPNGAAAATWPEYTMSDPYLELDDTIVAKSGYRTAQCDFWDTLIP